MDEETGRTSLEWAATTDSIEFAWWTPDADLEWTVKRDEKLHRTVDGTGFVDPDVDTKTGHAYTFTAEHDYVDAEGENQESSYIYFANIPPAPDSVEGIEVADPAVREMHYNTDVAGIAASSAAKVRHTTLAFASFIPEKRIAIPPPCYAPDLDQFGGDNRSFAKWWTPGADELSSRILSTAQIKWSDRNATSAEGSTSIGLTKGYKNGKLISTARASTRQSSVNTSLDDVGPFTNTRIKQKASDPLCPLRVTGGEAPDIDAEIEIELYGLTGALNVAGKHDGAPNYELTFLHQDRNGTMVGGCAYRFKRGSFMELLPPMDVNVDLSWNPTGLWNKQCPIAEEGIL